MLVKFLFLPIFYGGVLRAENFDRTKRFLVWPGGIDSFSRIQIIFGVGMPLDLEVETVIIGPFLKGNYYLPTNSSIYTQPYPPVVRQKRAASRWAVYKIIEQVLEMYNLGGKACLLRTICEFASTKMSTNYGGLIEEIAQLLFNPSKTDEDLTHYLDGEYHSARKLGMKFNGKCHVLFPDCNINLLDVFTVLK